VQHIAVNKVQHVKAIIVDKKDVFDALPWLRPFRLRIFEGKRPDLKICL